MELGGRDTKNVYYGDFMVKLHVGDSNGMPKRGDERTICQTDLGSSLYWARLRQIT